MPLGMEGGIVNAAGSREDRILPHTMIVNGRGRRFMNEAVNYYDAGESFGTKVGAAPRNYPAWMLFDQQGVERYALLAWKVPDEGTAEWLKVGQTLEELGAELDIDPAALAQSVERFNGFARSGKDEDFGRGDDPWDKAWGDPESKPNPCLGTLEKAPFYAIPIYPGALATRGGLRVDASGRVLSALSAEPIAGLYAAGNCSNGGPAGTYPGPGATIGAAMTFGYIVGRQIGESSAANKALRPQRGTP
jgi:3-oxosteroid 1-dehydrogenase